MSPVDEQLLSAYLDGALTERERAALEQRLASDPALRAALDDLRRTVVILGATPEIAPPRNFTLDPARYGRRRTIGLSAGLWRLGTALASILIVIGTVLFITSANRQAASPASVAGQSVTNVAVLATSVPSTQSATTLPVDEAIAASPQPIQPAPTETQRKVAEPTGTALSSGIVAQSTQAAAQNAPLPATVQGSAPVAVMPTTTPAMTNRPSALFAATAAFAANSPIPSPTATIYVAKAATLSALLAATSAPAITATAPPPTTVRQAPSAGAANASDANGTALPSSTPEPPPFSLLEFLIRLLLLLLGR